MKWLGFCLTRKTAIYLNRLRSAQAFTVEPSPIEAANASLDSSFAQRLTLSGWKARPRLRLRYGPIYVARFPAAPFPAASMEQAFLIRRARPFACDSVY